MRYTVRPISDRTAFTGKHEASLFTAEWPNTERILLREVEQLRGRDLVIEADVSEMDIRIDGRLRANARPSTPAIRVAFDSKHGPLTYATDRFMRWDDNVRAIALGLESLRRVDRYGITKRGEQYAGWKQIGGGPIALGAGMSPDAAYDVIAKAAGVSRDQLTVKSAQPSLIRRAKARAHPDRNGGDRTLWDQVEQAARILGIAS